MRTVARQLICVLVFVWIAPVAFGQTPTPQRDPATLFTQANKAFADADALASEDPEGARAMYRQSASLYGELVDQHAISNFMLHVNRGNALYRAGDVGRAIVAYRRAERLRPNDPRVRAGLAAARSRSVTEIAPGAMQRAADVLLWWRGFAPRTSLLFIGIGAYILLWLLAAARLLQSRAWLTRGALACSGIAALCFGSLLIENALVFHDRSVVVIASEVVGRNGPDATAYEATFSTPLQAGIEATILESRGDWVHLRLGDGRDTWLLATAIEVV